ncbi:DUF551 domain-containing protein [Kluyvera ascorbata]|uniref:DUF551 domain-containing protein n=1 Tax=Kluyvera ascorbata TaxID=51288 RepID=UPI002901837C|nr:DUF551 domain-containing protein [Kluyvera ascorbata]MDU1197742.1 DUF551 domain-containing protein [Kluyvera ascorbata]
MSELSQAERVPDDELDQMIWKLERDGGMTPKLLSLMRELRERRKADGWIPVSERMPLQLSDEDVDGIDVIVTDGVIVGTCECRRGYLPHPWVEWSNYGDIDAKNITHWMPLPAAPKEVIHD